MKKILFLLLPIFIVSCSPGTYIVPSGENKIQNSITINKPFDVVWSNLIDVLATTYFGIDSYEKQSGLMTLTFGASNPSDFIEGGQIKYHSLLVDFEGEYIDYLLKYFNTDFMAKMNIVVRAINENQTKVTVNARYVFSTRSREANFGDNWNFNTNSEDKHQLSLSSDKDNTTRILRPTHKAELDILNVLKAM